MRFAALILLTFSGFPAPAFSVDITVLDGDTIIVSGEHVRLINIDAPETRGRARCESERHLGERAKERMRALVASGAITITRAKRLDRYGRTLAHVSIDGRDLGDILVAEGLAVFWEGRRHAWCAARVN